MHNSTHYDTIKTKEQKSASNHDALHLIIFQIHRNQKQNESQQKKCGKKPDIAFVTERNIGLRQPVIIDKHIITGVTVIVENRNLFAFHRNILFRKDLIGNRSINRSVHVIG